MADQTDRRQLVAVAENLHILTNAYRDDGKYVIAGALYRGAIATLEGTGAPQGKHVLLARILEDQAAMLRKMECGSMARVVEQYARATRKK